MQILHGNCSFKFLIQLQEVEFSPGAFILDYERNKAADSPGIYGISSIRILSGLKGLEVNPWGFVQPLTPLVWVAVLTALTGVLAVLQLLHSCLPGSTVGRNSWPASNAFSCVRIILQQGEDSQNISASHGCMMATLRL